MEKFFYLLASKDITIKENEDSTYIFSYQPHNNVINFFITRQEKDLNYNFHLATKEECEELKKLISLPEIRHHIEEKYKYQIALDKAQKRYLQDLTRVLSTKKISNKNKFLIQAAAITAQTGFFDVKDRKIRFEFAQKNDQYTTKMLLHEADKTINLTPTLFVEYIQDHLLNSEESSFKPKNLHWWYNAYNSHNKKCQKEYHKMNKIFAKTETKPLKSRLNNKTKKLAEAREELIKSRSALPRDFRLDDPPSKRGRPRKNPANSQHNQQQDIEIENEK